MAAAAAAQARHGIAMSGTFPEHLGVAANFPPEYVNHSPLQGV